MRTLAIAVATLVGASTLVGGYAVAGRSTTPPPARETGQPVNCVNISQIRESRVRNDTVIDFRVSGNKWYRNTLPHRCSSLGFEERFTYTTSMNQLCSVDIIHVLQSHGTGLSRGPACGLGKFQPVELIKQPKAAKGG